MKKIPSWLILLGCEISVLLLLFAYGFKFTYAPELENSWAAISTVAAWAGVIVSSAAVFAAIQIPKKIAAQQNKIALFDKRYEALKEIEVINSFCYSLREQKLEKVTGRLFITWWAIYTGHSVEQDCDTSVCFETLGIEIMRMHRNASMLSDLLPLGNDKRFDLRDEINGIFHEMLSLITQAEKKPYAVISLDALHDKLESFFSSHGMLFLQYISISE